MDHSASMKMATKQGLEAAQAEGFAKGKTEGRAEGKTEGIKSTAKNILAKGLDTALIAELTGLPIEEIKRISTEPSPSA